MNKNSYFGPGGCVRSILTSETPKPLSSEDVVSYLKIETEKEIILKFYKEVCKRAEENMEKTGKLEGSHFAAMKSILKERGYL